MTSPHRGRAIACLVAGVAALAGASAGMLRGAEPFATWYFPLAWYATLLALDGAAALTGGDFRLLGRPAHLATLLGWSAVLWLFFEALNFRLRDWYYVFVPAERGPRWAGILLSFATVLPALFVTEALLEALGLARAARWPRLRVGPRLMSGLRFAGAASLLLPLLWPRLFFPLVWIALPPLVEPFTYRRDPARSLLGDLEAGRPGRLLRLLGAGALVGLLWELFNLHARGKWIYTVPGLEEAKLFEMPVLGFLGFPPFAVECFAVWQALVLAGLAVPRRGAHRRAPAPLRVAAAVAAIAFSAVVLAVMERRTISSLVPRLEDLPGAPAGALARAGYDVFDLGRASPAAVAADVGRVLRPRGGRAGSRGDVGRAAESRGSAREGERRASAWVESARLASLRGIGTGNLRRLRAVGIGTVEELAAADADSLGARLLRAHSPSDRDGWKELGGDATPARVRVWVRAAREAVRSRSRRSGASAATEAARLTLLGPSGRLGGFIRRCPARDLFEVSISPPLVRL